MSATTPRLDVLAGELETLRSEIAELDAVETPTDEQAERFSAALTEWDTTKAEFDRLSARAEQVEAVRQAAISAPNVERSAPEVITRTTSDPFDNLDAIRAGVVSDGDLRARALDAIEQAGEHMTDSQRERATQLVQSAGNKHSAGIARHVLLTGSPEYHAEFEEYARSGGTYVGPQLRAALSLTDANGGYMVPFTLDPTIILTNDGTANPFRQTATVKTITTDTWNGVSSAGVTAEWTAEAAEAADASSTFAQLSIIPARADAYVEGSYEVLSDSGFAGELGMLLADAKDRLEGTAFATGNGTNKPTGIVTQLVADSKTVTSTTTDTFARADVDKVMQALPPRHRSKAVWFANNTIYDAIRAFDTSGGSAFWANLGAATPEQLKGRPVYESSDFDGVINAAQENYVLAYVDMSTYYIVDRVGMSVLYEPMVKGANRRPTGQAGWFAMWRVGGKFVNSNGGRLLNVT
jgi:HK97 family phage major capsid protein